MLTKIKQQPALDCDVLVVGGGHAGCEAAAAAGRVGARTILLTGALEALGRMSCNPAIGGIAKGHLVREIDALGGIMPELTDRTAIQFRVLNRSKGFAVWSPRAQCDRQLYSVEMRRIMQEQVGVELVVGTAVSLHPDPEGFITASLLDHHQITAKTVVLSCGTFLNGLLHFGDQTIKGGRFQEPPVTGLTESLIELGFQAGRLKTGTPPRLDGRTINYDQVDRQDSDLEPIYFATRTTGPYLPQRPCWITHTNEDVHQTIREGLHRAPLYSGQIKGTGPRYCPSIEDKIVRFADKPRHTIFLEPEGLETHLVYPNGFSTSLPSDLQIAAMRKIKGLEQVEFAEFGYAIEYDYFPPHQLKRTLETKLVPGLFFSGQINGTSGYEEAAAQGLVAGCNAAHLALGSDVRLTLERDEAYTGVLIDDLITRGTDEPYRMFTSRAEFRLQLRLDNAEARLSEKAWATGLISLDRLTEVQNFEAEVLRFIDLLAQHKIFHGKDGAVSLKELLRRPEIKLLDLLPELNPDQLTQLDGIVRRGDFLRRVEAEIKYAGYLKRQTYRAEELRRNRRRQIPDDFDYTVITALSAEGREKLLHIRPSDLGEASNIPGITPSDMVILLIHLKRQAG